MLVNEANNQQITHFTYHNIGMKYPVISWLHRVNISSCNGLVSTTSLYLNQWLPNLSSHKWQLEHIFILPNSTKPSKVCKNPTILLNLSWNNLFRHVDSSVKHLTADRTSGSTFVGVDVRYVNNVNLTLIYGKLRQSTLTLTDYTFSTSFDQLSIFEQGDNKSQSGEIQQLHAMCGPVPKCCRFRRSRDGKN